MKNNLLKSLGTCLSKQRVVSKVLKNRKEILKTKCNLESSVPERMTKKYKEYLFLETTGSANIAFNLELPVLRQGRTPKFNCHLESKY